MQDDYALAERRYERSRAASRQKRGRSRSKTASSKALSSKRACRFEGFLAGACTTALAWLWTTRKSWMGA